MIHILLVEDSPTDAFLTREAVNPDWFHLTYVERLEQAIAALAGRTFDVVLLDLGLPDSQGLSTLHRLQREDSTTPVVVLSAKADEGLALEAVSAGAQDYLVKSQIDGGILERAIRYSVERRRIADSLRKSEARLHEAVRLARLGYWSRDLKTGHLEWSDLLFQMFEIDPATFDSTFEAFLSRLHPEDRSRVRETVVRAIAQMESFDHTYRIVCPSGTRFVHEEGRVYAGKDGTPVRISGTARDVTEQVIEATERKRAEVALRESERFAHSALDSLASHVVILDEQGVILATNKSWREFAERNGGDASKIGVGVNYLEFGRAKSCHVSETADQVRDAFREIVAGTRTEFSLEYECHSPTEQRWFVCKLSKFSGTGPVRVVVAHEDITSIKRARAMQRAKEEAERTSEAKSEFLATMSHELRTPLNGILGMNELLQMTTLTDQQREYLDASTNSGKTLLSLINDILDISKIEAGKIELDVGPCNFESLIYDATSMFSIQAKRKGVSLSCRLAIETCCTLLCDETRLRQILINLLGNALKFTSNGSVELKAECIRRDQNRIMIRILVSDTGVGIAEEKIAQIFTPFTQADQSTTRRYGGTGLGLSISKRLAELMGGCIGATSRLGLGSTFWLEVPFDITDDQVPASNVNTLLAAHRVLVVSSDDTLQQIKDWMNSWQCPFVHAAAPKEGAAALRQATLEGQPFSVVLADFQVAASNDFDLLQELAQGSKLPIICLGGDGDNDLAILLMKKGLTHLLNAPVRPSSLSHALTSVLAVAAPTPTQPLASVESQFAKLSAHVLVAEDNKINQMYVKELLKLSGCSCDIVETGDEALIAVANRRYDLVLMDCQMPEMDGFTATREIRRRERTGELPGRLTIIALTANAVKGDRERCLDAGMDEYLSKPIEGQQLNAVLAKHLQIASSS